MDDQVALCLSVEGTPLSSVSAGAVKLWCADCGQEIWVGLALQKRIAELIPLCPNCFARKLRAKRANGEEIKMEFFPDQVAEIAASTGNTVGATRRWLMSLGFTERQAEVEVKEAK